MEFCFISLQHLFYCSCSHMCTCNKCCNLFYCSIYSIKDDTYIAGSFQLQWNKRCNKQNMYYIAAFILFYCTWNQSCNVSLTCVQGELYEIITLKVILITHSIFKTCIGIMIVKCKSTLTPWVVCKLQFVDTALFFCDFSEKQFWFLSWFV